MMGPNNRAGILTTYREERYVTTEAETGRTQVQVKECQGLPPTTRSWEETAKASLEPSEVVEACGLLDYRLRAASPET